tara:strand:- start:66 stop:218 length:153 start_codon:yes stop_codon:yes gene_type:complete
LAHFIRFALASLKMHIASLGAGQLVFAAGIASLLAVPVFSEVSERSERAL